MKRDMGGVSELAKAVEVFRRGLEEYLRLEIIVEWLSVKLNK